MHNRFGQIFIAFILGGLLGLAVTVILLIPSWEQPEGLSARAIWGGIFFVAEILALLVGLVAVVAIVLVPPAHKKKVIVIECAMLGVFALVILVLPGLT